MREYGGYLPLEICQGHELYRGEDVVSLNCGRNAIVYAALAEKYSKLYIPLWTCESIQKSLDQYGIYYETYHIDSEFMPIDVTLEENESILWTNYFGLIDGQKIEALFINIIIMLLLTIRKHFLQSRIWLSIIYIHVENLWVCLMERI